MGGMSPRRQGDLGELSAMDWLSSHGCRLLTDRPQPRLRCGRQRRRSLQRVQVKTTRRYYNRRWNVMVCTRGGNQSWNGLVKRFSSSRCDWLFVLVADGRRWFIPAEAIAAGTCVLLGGPKYAEFEVEAGRPFHL